MNRIAAILVILATLAAAPAAHALIYPPIGETVCSGDGCVTIDASDQARVVRTIGHGFKATDPPGPVRTPAGVVTWDRWSSCSSVSTAWGPFVGGSCIEIPCAESTWEILRTHTYRRSQPYMRAIVTRCYQADGSTLPPSGPDSVTISADLDTADCNPTGENERWMTTYPGLRATGYIATADAPSDFVNACNLLDAAAAQQQVEADRAARDASMFGSATARRRCGYVSRARVVSKGLPCRTSRSVLRLPRSAARRLGYTCTGSDLWKRCRRSTGRLVFARTIIRARR